MNQRIRPFLKWAGGKFKLCDWINQYLPSGPRLIEPFVGAAAVFLNSSFDRYLLNDCNPDLINLYQILQQEGESFVQYCHAYFNKRNNTVKRYYHFRQQFNISHDRHEKAALFLYLNRHGFNGLCRYNQKGEFNVPMGQYDAPYFPYDEMLAFHEKAQNALFTCADFTTVMCQARAKEVIYCDPPYYPLSQSARFTRYHHHDFCLEKQSILAELCQQLTAKGVHIIVSNHALPETRRLYHAAEKFVYCDVTRYISAKGDNRKSVKELLAVYSKCT
jgi:DNA adenine methylase